MDGIESDPEILEWIREYFPGITDDSEVAWCSIFMNHVADLAGLERTGKATARSWLDVGIEIDQPKTGDVVIFWRESINSWKGHVGIYINDRGDGRIRVLGGNQSNAVNIRSYSKGQVLGYRRLQKQS